MTTSTRHNPATERQVAFITRLRSERGLEPLTDEAVNELTNGIASVMIGSLLSTPALHHERAREDVVTETLTPGVYRHDGTVYLVKPNKDRSRLYAKRLVEIRGERLTEAGTHVQVEFEYAPGVVYQLRADERLSLAEGRELTIRYGKCICCGRKLKAAESVERGIGPVCAGYFA